MKEHAFTRNGLLLAEVTMDNIGQLVVAIGCAIGSARQRQIFKAGASLSAPQLPTNLNGQFSMVATLDKRIETFV